MSLTNLSIMLQIKFQRLEFYVLAIWCGKKVYVEIRGIRVLKTRVSIKQNQKTRFALPSAPYLNKRTTKFTKLHTQQTRHLILITNCKPKPNKLIRIKTCKEREKIPREIRKKFGDEFFNRQSKELPLSFSLFLFVVVEEKRNAWDREEKEEQGMKYYDPWGLILIWL